MQVHAYMWIYGETQNFREKIFLFFFFPRFNETEFNPADNLRQINLTRLLVQSRHVLRGHA